MTSRAITEPRAAIASTDPVTQSLRGNGHESPGARGELPNGSAPVGDGQDRAVPDAAAAPLKGKAGELRRSVLVMMPFRSDDSFERRVQVLDFLRLKYITERIVTVHGARAGRSRSDESVTNGAHPKIQYKVNALHHRVGYFPERALNAIAEADVLIGLVTSQSGNVMFELTTRHLLRDGLVLLVDGDRVDLPIYFEGMIKINYRKLKSVVVDEAMRQLAARNERPADYNDDAPPDELIAEIEKHDQDLACEIEHALREVERAETMRPAYIRNLARYVSPSAIVESWESLNPFCVVEVEWSRMSGDGHYNEDDISGGPWVCSANKSFLDFYGLRTIPDPAKDAAHALDADRLISRLENLKVCTEGLKEFREDQAITSQAVFFREKNISASIPIVINDKHDLRFQNQRFLPTVVGRTTVGDRQHQHRSYLLVLYVPIGANVCAAIAS